ncbi:MAG: methyltransferase domain-containing protein [Gammaproteobacteria bacterium]|nr:methyltransferase domain-containing protein [Gammaproteobacteria bacterium]
MTHFNDEEIIDSWKTNARCWIKAIREDEIESRLLVTNKAIVNAITSRQPATVLDAGCGEGWLVRELEKTGIKALGLDAVPELIAAAQKEAVGRFKCLSYKAITQDRLKESFDVVVCNFSLLGDDSVTHLFAQVPSLLNKGGAFIVQTLHPQVGLADGDYNDGWRQGSWAGFNEHFSQPAPWYCRSLKAWKLLYLNNGMKLLHIDEPIHPKTQKAASIIFSGIKKC